MDSGASAAAAGAPATVSSSTDGPGPRLSPALLRKALKLGSPAEILDLLADEFAAAGSSSPSPTPDECSTLLCAALSAGNVALALALYDELCAAYRNRQGGLDGGTAAAATSPSGSSAASSSSATGGVAAAATLSSLSSSLAPSPSPSPSSFTAARWPAVTLPITAQLVLGLCKQLSVADALAVLRSLRSKGLPASAEVQFGLVVTSPLAPGKPLTVVQPQEGCKLVADAFSRYEYDVFSGAIITCK